MSFDANLFLKATINHRESDVKVPALQDFFGKDEPIFKVKALSGEQIAIVNEAAERNKNLNALMSALVGGSSEQKSAAVKSLMGVGSDEVPEDTAKRIEVLIMGSVDPVCDRDMAIKINEYFPLDFTKITNEIYRLTGEGGDIVGKPKPSTVTKK